MSDDAHEIIQPKTPGLLARKELARFLAVDRDEIPGIVCRFGLRLLEDRFIERDVWRQVLGLEPVDDVAGELLRQRLRNIAWVGCRIGKAPSTVRDKIRRGTFEYSDGVQLGADKPDRAPPRMRRFVPALIEAQRCGAEAPFREVHRRPVVAQAAEELTDPAAASETTPEAVSTAEDPAQDAPHIVFGQMVRDKAQ
jgi:hypothetical protein